MLRRSKQEITIPSRTTWRRYQAHLNRRSSRRRTLERILKLGALALVAVCGFFAVIGEFGDASSRNGLRADNAAAESPGAASGQPPPAFHKQQVQTLLGETTFINLDRKSFAVNASGRRLRVDTSLDMSLQTYLRERLNTANALYIGIVAMEPTTGRVLAMVGYDKNGTSDNPCVTSEFPAASVFKIVTAAAAIEQHDYRPGTLLTYNGQKYTLYRSQLKDKKNRWTRKTTLKDSFAQSINPVFGKIGALVLGRQALEDYGRAFGFNLPIEFEIPLSESPLTLQDDPYQWAEIASGFNKETKISPLHGAIMTSAVLNRGQLPEPIIIDRIVSSDNQIVYAGSPKPIRRAVTPEASLALNRLMAETVRTGTGRKAFRGYQRDRTLSHLNIGGKTGSISGDTAEIRYDWFVGFAEEKKGTEKLVLSIVVAHDTYIGIRAGEYARMAMKHYFQQYFAETQKQKIEG